MDPDRFNSVVHTGLQTLALMAVGWAAARWQLLRPAATPAQAVSLINTLVMRICLPALQLLLLGVHTDMRELHTWKLLAAFSLWTGVVQAGCGAWCVACEGGRLDRWGLHALVLAANNTGILAPVVLEAALGPGAGSIGMLATVCLYFQQLPVSEALMASGAPEPGLRQPASLAILLGQNPLVWTTGGAALLSVAGSTDFLAPTGTRAVPQLAFVHGSLEWLARCSVPLTLLSTGMWLHGRVGLVMSGTTVRLAGTYLVLKLAVLPWLMVIVTGLLGITGRHGLALLLLTAVPVGQTAFVVSERQACGTEAVTATLIAGLLLMLPHVLLVLWVADRLGLYRDQEAQQSPLGPVEM